MSARRERHGRGLRGPLAPRPVPIAQTPTEMFDSAVLDAVEHLEAHGLAEIGGIEFAVEDVPSINPGDSGYALEVLEDARVPLAQAYPAGLAEITSPLIVLYRRPLEARAHDVEDLAGLIHDVVVDRVAHLLGRDPGEIDPHYEDE